MHSGQFPEASPALRLLRRLLKRRVLRRGTGRVFDLVPLRLWGGAAVEVPTEVGPMVLPVADHGVRELLLYGTVHHEMIETEAVAALLQGQPSVVVDVGSSVGWYARLAAKETAGRGQVLAVEANPFVFPYLDANTRRFRSITSVHAAVARGTGSTSFFCASSSTLSSAVRDVGQLVTVPALALDDLWKEHLDDVAVHLVKCDVEGGEVDVLAGARGVRSSSSPPIWLLELSEQHLAQAGTSVHELDGEIDGFGKKLHRYFLNETRQWEPVPSLAELSDRKRLVNNVFLVPEDKVSAFGSTVPGVQS